MGEDCIFCKIIAGEVPCSKVYETEGIFAFLDISPANAGHALVIPKDHHPQIWDLPGECAEELLTALKRVGKAVMEATEAEGLNIGMNNYAAAGQLVMHSHFHLIPRYDDDGLDMWPGGQYASKDEMNALAEKIREQLS